MAHALRGLGLKEPAKKAWEAYILRTREPPLCSCGAVWEAKDLEEKGDLDGAAHMYFTVLRMDYERHRFNSEKLQRYRGLASGSPRTRRWVAQQVRLLERSETLLQGEESVLSETFPLLPDLLRGRARPERANQYYGLAMVQSHRGRWAEAARLVLEAYRRDPSIFRSSDSRLAGIAFYCLNASRVPAGAPDAPAERERAALRAETLKFLRLAMGVLEDQGRDEGAIVDRNIARNTVAGWKSGGALPVPGKMDWIPVAEHAAWESFWKEADAFLRGTWRGTRR
jgi:hypothetical protein